MARKGNRQRNGLDRNIPNQKHAVSESIDASLSDDKHEKSTACDKKRVGIELSTGDPKCSSTSPSGERLSNSKHMGSGKRKQQFQSIPSRETSKNTSSNISESVDMSSQVRDDVGNDLSGASKSRIDDEVLYGSNNNLRDTSSMAEDVSVKNIMAGCMSLLAVVCRNLRVSVLPTLKVAEGWLEQQKPRFKAFMNALSYAHSCIRVKVDYAYPIIRTWVCYFGQLLFALSMVWMDCNIRGLDSLLRLGTTSFLTVVWCSILSITAMIGLAKMLMILVVAALMVVFIGFAFAIFIVTILAVVILWLYGNFWTTGFVIFLGGITLASRHERVALLVTVLYSMHCARSYIGWLGLLLGLNLAFISSDVLAHILKNVSEYKSNVHPEESQAREGHFSGLHSSPVDDASQPAYGISADRNSGVPSTSGATTELTPEDEINQLLNCNDHYSALGLKRYENIDVSSIKREYRKKAMLVHPDKNMGNEKAVEAFKKLQNAYEVLLDSLKRQTYDDELRREETLDYIRRFQTAAQKNGKHGTFSSTFNHFRDQDESSRGESRRIACKKCNDFHIWIRVERSKSQARWCQDCKDFHQAKDGDGWVEQSCQPLLFGLLQKMDPPSVYVCAESRIYDATEWFICQGMRCPPNTHKPSFHVNANITKGTNSTRRGGVGGATADMEETMTEEEFFEWLQNAVQSGMFEASSATNENPSPQTGSTSKSSTKKRKGKKQW